MAACGGDDPAGNSMVTPDARVLPDVGLVINDGGADDAATVADGAVAGDSGPGPDGAVPVDGGPVPDGAVPVDGGPGPDGAVPVDGGPVPDGAVPVDGGPGPDGAVPVDGGPVPDGAVPVDGGPVPDAGPVADGGVPVDGGVAVDGGVDAGPGDVGPIDAGTLVMTPTSTSVPMGQTARFAINAPQGAAVQWSVEGAVGGGIAIGTIVPQADARSAIYTAPTVVGNPPPGSYQVSALTGTETVLGQANLEYVAPVITAFAPAELVGGQGTITASVSGTGFTSRTEVYLDGLRLGLRSSRWDLVTFDINAALLIFPGPKQVVIRNPLPGGGQASVTVIAVLRSTTVDPNVPADVPAVFTLAGVGADPVRTPSITYPEPFSLVPRDFPAPEVSFAPFASHNVCRLQADGPGVDLEYFVSTNGLTAFENPRAMIDTPTWGRILTSNQGITVVFQVACAEVAQVGGASQIVGGSIYESAPITYTVEPFGVGGRIIYFSGSIAGLWRIEMGSLTPQADPWVGPAPAFAFQTPGCVGCHSLAPNGAEMAYTSGNSQFGVFNTLGGVPTVSTGLAGVGDAEWTAIHPSGRWVIGLTVTGTLVLYDAATGQSVTPVPSAGGRTLTTQPFWSPQGDALVFVATNQMAGGVHDVFNGEIWTVPFTPTVGAPAFGTPTQIVSAQNGSNFYPAYSPDGQWLVFSQAPNGASYDNAGARAQLIAANGAGGVVDLGRANQGRPNNFNSWPRWAPATQGGKYWIVYSSKRPYPPLNGTGPQQLWVSQIDPSRLPADPSSPGVWLPGQEAFAGNLTAEWSTSQ